jgi:allantoicase
MLPVVQTVQRPWHTVSDHRIACQWLHSFINEILAHEKISHIRVNMIPDGGISRIRLWGKVAD